MRSRYSAFALGNAAYIAHSWHPDTAPHELHLEASPSWCALEILTTEEGGENDRKGMVEFKAHYMNGGKSVAIHEVSRFVKEKGRWYYVDGDIMTNDATKAPKTGRNEPCPCGSGKKFKKCCMA
jgi:SEC-C motif-containing protein